MELTVKGEAKEIAAFVLAIQKQQYKNETFDIYMNANCLTKHDNREEAQEQSS